MCIVYTYIGLTRDKEEREADEEGEGEGATPRVRSSRAKVAASSLAATGECMYTYVCIDK